MVELGAGNSDVIWSCNHAHCTDAAEFPDLRKGCRLFALPLPIRSQRWVLSSWVVLILLQSNSKPFGEEE